MNNSKMIDRIIEYISPFPKYIIETSAIAIHSNRMTKRLINWTPRISIPDNSNNAKPDR
jgi:hypothetical protein